MGSSSIWSRSRVLLVALTVAIAACVAVGSVAAAPAPKALPAAQTYSATGAEQSYVVPAGLALVETDLAGGNGGGGGAYGMAEGGYLRVHAGEKLYVEVGANGAYEGAATFGGGGAAGAFAACPQADPDGRCGGAFAGSGGGASDVRTCSELAKRCARGGSTLTSRIIVAGGGGGQGGDGFSPGWYCTQLPQKGFGLNRQALPGGTPANGPAPVKTAGGLLVPGEPADYTYGGPIKDVTASAGGAASPGAGGSMSECDTQEVNNGSILANRFTGSIAGAAGAGPNGGAGAAVAGAFAPEGPNGYLPGSGGGGGGGYTGGGGGSTGEVCSYSVSGGACYDPGGGMGGGGGSSFFAKTVLGAFIDPGPASGPAITITPLVEINRPKNGAVYTAGKRIRAQWECGHYQGFACSGATAADGAEINMKPGKHTFVVKVSLSPSNASSSAKVTYTVR
jgi:hypothetical protein